MRFAVVPFLLLLAAAPSTAKSTKTFDENRFSFTFQYDASWIPSVQAEGESVSFTLSEGELHVSAQRDPNPKHIKTRTALADEHIAIWKNRDLDFSSLEKKETTMGAIPATLVTGAAKLYDATTPYRLQIYILEKDGRFYVVKYSGLYDPSLPYWAGFEQMVKSFRFRDLPARTASATPVPTANP